MAAAAQQNTPARSSTFETRLFGTIEVSEEQRITLPGGIIGFATAREFALLPAGPENFYWLQSLEHTTLAFLLVDPFPYFADYSIDVPDQVVARLSAERAADVSVLVVLTLAGEGQGATANLQGPILINLAAGIGEQYVVQNSPYSTREAIPADRMPQ
jgi:flagellar assembly factor FliW